MAIQCCVDPNRVCAGVDFGWHVALTELDAGRKVVRYFIWASSSLPISLSSVYATSSASGHKLMQQGGFSEMGLSLGSGSVVPTSILTTRSSNYWRGLSSCSSSLQLSTLVPCLQRVHLRLLPKDPLSASTPRVYRCGARLLVSRGCLYCSGRSRARITTACYVTIS
jgi:hypothetical protein